MITNVVLVGQVLCILVPFVIWFMPLDVDPTIKHVLAIVGFMRLIGLDRSK
jgi:hypothetical protein